MDNSSSGLETNCRVSPRRQPAASCVEISSQENRKQEALGPKPTHSPPLKHFTSHRQVHEVTQDDFTTAFANSPWPASSDATSVDDETQERICVSEDQGKMMGSGQPSMGTKKALRKKRKPQSRPATDLNDESFDDII